MSRAKLLDNLDPKQQQDHEQEAVERWGEGAAQSIQLWNSYSDERKEAILQEASAIYQSIVEHMGEGPDSVSVQNLLVQWHENLRNFYEPSIEVLEGLGVIYHDDPRFNATFTEIHPDLPAFLKQAIAIYTDELATQWLERELAILEE